jgi:hypothetical protein
MQEKCWKAGNRKGRTARILFPIQHMTMGVDATCRAADLLIGSGAILQYLLPLIWKDKRPKTAPHCTRDRHALVRILTHVFAPISVMIRRDQST